MMEVRANKNCRVAIAMLVPVPICLPLLAASRDEA